MVKKFIPEQGDIIFVSFDPTIGREQRGYRPAIVVSKTDYNKTTGLFLCCPITSKRKGYIMEALINGYKIRGVALCDQIRVFDALKRTPKFIERCGQDTFSAIQNIIISLIQ